MVRFENQAVKSKPLEKSSYTPRTSLWDTVLTTTHEPGNDRSFEKSDLQHQEKSVKMALAETTGIVDEHKEAEPTTATTTRRPAIATEMQEEKKCAEVGDEASPLKSTTNVVASVESPTSTCSATDETEEEEEEEDQYAQRSPSQYEAPQLPDDEAHAMEKAEPTNSSSAEVTLAYKPEEDKGIVPAPLSNAKESAEAALVEKLKASGKADPDMISQLLTQMVSEAAKKELETRLQQQQEPKKGEPEPMDDEVAALERGPMDAESLAKAQAKLMEQAKSLAKAQAMIQAQAKALARMEQQQSTPPAVSPAVSPPRATLTKPHSVRAPSDEVLTETRKSPTGTTATAAYAKRLASSLSESGKSETTVVTSNKKSTQDSIKLPGREEILSVLDGEWLAQAKSEAQAKAQALIRTAQAEASARAEARKIAKERALAEERARQKEEVEADLKAKAVRDAWEFEQTEAAFRAEERARAKAKAAAKAAAEEKMRRKADTDTATNNVMDAARAQAKEEAEYKIKLKAEADAKYFAECKARRTAQVKARKEAMEKTKEEEATAKIEADRQRKLREIATEEDRVRRLAEAEEKIRLKAETDAKWLAECKARRIEQVQLRQEALEKAKVSNEQQSERAKKETERQQKIQEMAAAQAKADAEHKMRLKAEADAKWLEDHHARKIREAEDRIQALAEAKAEAKVRAKALALAEQNYAKSSPPRNKGILSPSHLMKGAQSFAAAKKLLLEQPNEFVPFGKSKGEEVDGDICLFLQVPGVVHPKEVKVELEDGVLYISRGIVLNGVEGVQKYTRSFPFEEQLLDTQRISVTLIPANATADGVSVLQFCLPKVQSTWKIPMSLAEPEPAPEETEPATVQDEECSPSPGTANEGEEHSKGTTEVSLDAPDDEVSLVHPSDEVNTSNGADDADAEEEKAAETEAETDDAPSSTSAESCAMKDSDTYHIISLQVPPGIDLNDISAIYGEESVHIIGKEGSFQHVFSVSSEEVEVRQLAGSYDPEGGLLIIKAPLVNASPSEPKARRIKVTKMEETLDITGYISVFPDDVSLSSKGSLSNHNTPEHKKKGKGPSIKSLASKYFKFRPKKLKHEMP